MIGWTTVDTLDNANSLAQILIDKKLIACAQIDGPITSIYPWQGKLEHSQEYRLNLKFPESNLSALESAVTDAHPYETPQWLVVSADNTLKGYSDWAHGVGRVTKENFKS